MEQENKELLLKDLCARLPYNFVYCYCNASFAEGKPIVLTPVVISNLMNATDDLVIKPYLRPMSSMTEEEWEELNYIGHIVPLYDGSFGVDMRAYCKNSQPHYRRFSEFSAIEDWLNAHHFDYRGLIPMKLAIEAPKDMYNDKRT